MTSHANVSRYNARALHRPGMSRTIRASQTCTHLGPPLAPTKTERAEGKPRASRHALLGRIAPTAWTLEAAVRPPSSPVFWRTPRSPASKHRDDRTSFAAGERAVGCMVMVQKTSGAGPTRSSVESCRAVEWVTPCEASKLAHRTRVIGPEDPSILREVVGAASHVDQEDVKQRNRPKTGTWVAAPPYLGTSTILDNLMHNVEGAREDDVIVEQSAVTLCACPQLGRL